MAAKPAFAATPRQSSGAATTADTSYTAPTNAVAVFTAGASGSRVERLRLMCTGTSLAGLVNIFLYDGTTYRLIRSIVTAAITASATVAPWGSDDSGTIVFPGGLQLPAGYSIRIATTVAQTIVGSAEGGDY